MLGVQPNSQNPLNPPQLPVEHTCSITQHFIQPKRYELFYSSNAGAIFFLNKNCILPQQSIKVDRSTQDKS